MIKLKDILNESKWFSTKSTVADIFTSGLIKDKEVLDKVKEILPRISSVSSVVDLINQNREKLANLLTKFDYSADNNNPDLYKKAAEAVYNSTQTQTIINNTITEIINKLSTADKLKLKASWAVFFKSSLKSNIKYSIAKIVIADLFNIRNRPQAGRYLSALTIPSFNAANKQETIFNSDPLTDSIYNTLNNLL